MYIVNLIYIAVLALMTHLYLVIMLYGLIELFVYYCMILVNIFIRCVKLENCVVEIMLVC